MNSGKLLARAGWGTGPMTPGNRQCSTLQRC